MEAIILCGIQGTGKSTFYRQRFLDSHMRINLDMLRTRFREGIFVRACIEAKQPFVVDNTNPTSEERAQYIAPAKAAGFRVVGYYFRSSIAEAIERNGLRPAHAQVPHLGILGTHGRLQIPAIAEGFDQLFYVSIDPSGDFRIEEWRDEV